MSDASKTLNHEQPIPFSNGPFIKASFLQALKVWWALTWRVLPYIVAILVMISPFYNFECVRH